MAGSSVVSCPFGYWYRAVASSSLALCETLPSLLCMGRKAEVWPEQSHKTTSAAWTYQEVLRPFRLGRPHGHEDQGSTEEEG